MEKLAKFWVLNNLFFFALNITPHHVLHGGRGGNPQKRDQSKYRLTYTANRRAHRGYDPSMILKLGKIQHLNLCLKIFLIKWYIKLCIYSKQHIQEVVIPKLSSEKLSHISSQYILSFGNQKDVNENIHSVLFNSLEIMFIF